MRMLVVTYRGMMIPRYHQRTRPVNSSDERPGWRRFAPPMSSSPRIGVVAYWKGYDRKLYLRAVKLADELGYDSFWVPEAWGYDVVALLGEMAGATKRIRL